MILLLPILLASASFCRGMGMGKQVVCLTVAAGVHVFISGESLHCFLVGWCTNKSYVIATSDL